MIGLLGDMILPGGKGPELKVLVWQRWGALAGVAAGVLFPTLRVLALSPNTIPGGAALRFWLELLALMLMPLGLWALYQSLGGDAFARLGFVLGLIGGAFAPIVVGMLLFLPPAALDLRQHWASLHSDEAVQAVMLGGTVAMLLGSALLGLAAARTRGPLRWGGAFLGGGALVVFVLLGLVGPGALLLGHILSGIGWAWCGWVIWTGAEVRQA